jgi:hypothetical protein
LSSLCKRTGSSAGEAVWHDFHFAFTGWRIQFMRKGMKSKILFADFFFVILSRGSGFLITAAMLLANSITRGSAAYSQIGQDLALAAFVVGAPLGILSQIQIRRVSAHGDFARYLAPAKIVSSCTIVACLLSMMMPSSLVVWKIGVKTFFEALAFILGQSVLVSLLLLSSLSKNTRTQISILVLMGAGIAGFAILRIFASAMISDKGLILEDLIIWLAGVLALLAASRVRLLPFVADVYPFSVAAITKYAMIIFFFNGLFVLDWRLLKAFLTNTDFVSVSQLRVTLERLLMPVLATTASALLVGSYRKSRIEPTSPGKTTVSRLSRQKIFGATISVAVAAALASLHWSVPVVLLTIGYLAAAGVSYNLDLFQAKFSPALVAASLFGYFALYAVTSWLAISKFGVAGHALAWLSCNLLLAALLSRAVALPVGQGLFRSAKTS